MKKLLLSLFLIFTAVFVSAQCSIDYNYSPSANYGLSPDSLPDGFVGQFYDEDMTFLMPLDTVDQGLTVTFEDFHIISISLPLGLTWECNNSANGCHYDPAVSQYGCVNVSGNALIPGYYDVEVTLVATHDLSSIVGTADISFTLPLTIYPDTSTASNAGFAMSNPTGCSPVTVSFVNNNTNMLSYFWDFGNGNTSSLAQPADQIYNQPGQYIVNYSAIQSNPIYFLESIEVVTGGCTDNILIGDVDLLYDIFTQSGMVQQVSASNAITQAFPLMINLSSPLQLTGQDVTIDVWDDDGWPWGLEYCGGLTFTPQLQAGTFSSNGGGLSINYTVMEVPANTLVSTDTINVHGYPQLPNLVYDTLNNIIYTNSDSIAMQWYYYSSPIPGATDTFIYPTSSGLYSLVVVNEFGCSSSSNDVLVVICDSLYQPTLDDNGSTAWMLDSALYSNLQWYDSNGIIPGATQSFYPATSNGLYYIVATDEFGCSYSSQTVMLTPVVMNSELFSYSNLVSIGPNPFGDISELRIYIHDTRFSEADIIVRDVFGRMVIEKTIRASLFPYKFTSSEISKLKNGLYYFDISFEGKRITKKLVKTSN